MTLLYTVGVVIALVFTSLTWRWASRHGFIHLGFALAGASGRCGRCTPLTAFTTVGWLPRVRTTGA